MVQSILWGKKLIECVTYQVLTRTHRLLKCIKWIVVTHLKRLTYGKTEVRTDVSGAWTTKLNVNVFHLNFLVEHLKETKKKMFFFFLKFFGIPRESKYRISILCRQIYLEKHRKNHLHRPTVRKMPVLKLGICLCKHWHLLSNCTSIAEKW